MFNDLFSLNLITRKDREAPIKIAYLKIEKHQLKLPPPSEVFCFENVFLCGPLLKSLLSWLQYSVLCFGSLATRDRIHTPWIARKVPSELVFYGLSFHCSLHVDVNKLGYVCAHLNVKLITFDFFTLV